MRKKNKEQIMEKFSIMFAVFIAILIIVAWILCLTGKIDEFAKYTVIPGMILVRSSYSDIFYSLPCL